jgi:hypothetical protein
MGVVKGVMLVGLYLLKISITSSTPLSIIMAPNTASSSSIACGCNFLFKANNSRFIYLDRVYIFEIFHKAKVR